MGAMFQGILEFFLNMIGGTLLPNVLIYALQNNKIEEVLSGIQGFSESVFLPIASVLVCICFTLELMQKVTSDNFNTDQFIKMLLKLAIEIVIINNATQIAKKIVKFGIAFTGAVGGGSSEMAGITVSEIGFIQGLVLIVVMILPFFISLVAFIIGYFQVYSYQLEFTVYAAAAPLGLADFLSNGIHSNGMKYMKKLLALAIQGGIMILILAAASILQQEMVGGISFSLSSWDDIANMLKSLFNTFFACIGIQLAVVGTLGQAKTISQAIIG